jgi:hypothetical protein
MSYEVALIVYLVVGLVLEHNINRDHYVNRLPWRFGPSMCVVFLWAPLLVHLAIRYHRNGKL